MSAVGYSGTPLPRKLGIEESSRLLLAGAPPDFGAMLGGLPPGVEHVGAGAGEVDVIVVFVRELAPLRAQFGALAAALRPAGGLWVAWPKRSSGVATDLSENVVRDVGLGEGLVDNKVCAIDEVWSGLKFVRRLEDRG